MPPNRKPAHILLSITFVLLLLFLLLFLLFYFAYFSPARNEHDRIAKLPSHDLTLFVDGAGRFAHNDQFKDITYNGQGCRIKEDFINALNGDMLLGGRGYYYFYDAENKLYMKLSADTHFWKGDGSALFNIEKYPSFNMYFENSGEPFMKALGLGPVYCWIHELSTGKASQVGTISEARYWFLYQYSPGDIEVSALSASLQLAFAFALYLTPVAVCILLRKKRSYFAQSEFISYCVS